MSDAALNATDDDPDVDALVEALADAHDDLERARRRVRDVGEDTLTELADRYEELTALFDRYEERVTGDGDFQTFIEFQGEVETFTETLPEDLRHREVFEAVDDLLQQRRLTESDWRHVRETLEPVRTDVERLDERERARERYRDARHAVVARRDDLAERIADLEHLQRLGEADLDAPTGRLRDPVESYNGRVTDAFETFTGEADARTVLDVLAATDAYPLVDFRAPPADLHEYVDGHEAGTETLAQLLEYADFSRSKLSHYVDDPDALKQAVGTSQTYLRRLDADPLTVDWPPPEAGVLRYRCRELTSVVARFAGKVDEIDGEGTLVALRRVRDLPRETDYERLRESAQARAQLGDRERDRLASGAVADELATLREAKRRLAAALDEHPEL